MWGGGEMTELIKTYGVDITLICMCLSSLGLILLADYYSHSNEVIRGLKNQVKMKDERITLILKQLNEEQDIELKYGHCFRLHGLYFWIDSSEVIFGEGRGIIYLYDHGVNEAKRSGMFKDCELP
jgi:hypothetical protein